MNSSKGIHTRKIAVAQRRRPALTFGSVSLKRHEAVRLSRPATDACYCAWAHFALHCPKQMNFRGSDVTSERGGVFPSVLVQSIRVVFL